MKPRDNCLLRVMSMLVLLFGSLPIFGHAQVINCLTWSPNQMMEKLALTKEVKLENSPDIYFRVAEFVQEQDLLNSEESKRGWPSTSVPLRVCIAWMSNPEADNKHLKIALQKGISVAEAIRQIAKARGESIKDKSNFFLIQSSPRPVDFESYRVKSLTEDQDLSGLVHCIILPGQTKLEKIDARTLEAFIGDQMKATSDLTPNRKIGPFKLKVDASADQAVGKVNVMGMWTYSELLNVYCALGGLHWKIEGKDLLLSKDFKP